MGRESRYGFGLTAAVCALLVGCTGAATALAQTPSPAAEGASAATVAPSTGPTFVRPGPARTQTRAHGVHRISRLASAEPLVTSAPAPPSPNLSGAALVSPLTNFNGVSSRDSALVNSGLEVEPPDQGLCVGNGFVIDMVNSAYSVYDTSGKRLQGPVNINSLFREALTEFTSDPRCYYDTSTKTWFATTLSINPSETESFIDIAVNNSGDPRTAWTVYKVNVSDVGGATGPKHAGCPCFGDQPALGIDSSNLYVTTDEFALASEAFKGAQIYAFAKTDLVAAGSTLHFVHFDKLRIGGSLAASVQPAITTGNPPAEYLLNSIDPSETSGKRIGVWAMTERGAVAKGGVPKLSSLVLGSEPFGVPPGAQQKGTSRRLDSGDDRMQQVQYIGGSIWGELGTSVAIPGDATVRAGAAWFQVQATVSEGALAAATINRQGYVAVAHNYVLYPALQIAPSGGGAMVFTLTGASSFPSAAYSTYSAAEGSFGAPTVAAAGSTNYDPKGERWGDYSFAVLDPGGTSVWGATEYVPPPASQTTNGKANWGTRVMQLPAG